MDKKIRFISPHGPRKNFFWPQGDDICWVSHELILKVLPSLSSTSQLRRTYKLDAVDFEAIHTVI